MDQTLLHDTAAPQEPDERPLDRVLSRLDNVHDHGHYSSARCPAHDDRNNSLSVRECEDRKVHIKCFAGCLEETILSAVGLSWPDLYPASQVRPTQIGVTVESYADLKNLDPDYLKERFQLKTIKRNGETWMEIPSLDEEGQRISTSYRKRLGKTNGIDDRFQRKRGDPAVPYGLWLLEQARQRGYIVLPEGESDVHTLAYYGEPALGLPGASTWKEEYAAHLDGIDVIYVVIENDKGGEALKAAIAKSSIRPRVRIINLGEFNDPSGLHCADPALFYERWTEAKANAQPLPDPADTSEAEAATAYEHAQDLLHAPDLLAQVSAVVTAGGYAGDTTPVLGAYTGITSRVLPRPMNLTFVAQSSAGKNRAVDEGRALHPDEAVYHVKAASERALIYNTESFEHRTVIFAEADSIPEDGPAASAIRNLASDNVMEYEVTIPDDVTGAFKTLLIQKPGPTGLITTSTQSPRYQLGTRMLEYPIPDDEQQTRAIMRAQAQRAMPPTTEPPNIEPFIAAQRYLAIKGERQVAVPYALVLADMLPATAVRTRRDFPQLLTAIQTVAYLHQLQRERTSEGWVVSTIEDYAWARRIYGSCFDLIAADGVTPQIRLVVEAVREDDEDGITQAELARRTGKSTSTISYHVKRALEHGWLVNDGKGGRAGHLLKRGDPLPQSSRSVLPTPDELREIFESSNRNGGEDDPSPSPPSPNGRPKTGDHSTKSGAGAGQPVSRESLLPSEHHGIPQLGPTSPPIPFEDSKISLISAAVTLVEMLATLQVRPVIGLDCETTGLDPLSDSLRLVTIATADEVLVIDVTAIPQWTDMLRPILTDPETTKVLHNAKFDLAFLARAGIEVSPVFDTMLAGQLLDGGRNFRTRVDDPSGQLGRGNVPAQVGYHTLSALAHRELSIVLDKTHQTADWSATLSEELVAYAAQDAAVLLSLYCRLTERLSEMGLTEVAALEFATAPAIVWLEDTGTPLDTAAWTAERDRSQKQLETLTTQIGAMLPGVNINSSNQLKRALTEIGVDVPNVQEGTLREVAGAHPVIDLILAAKDASKRVGTYGDGYLEKVHPATGRIHADYKQIGTETGRMACSKPNLQNIPRDRAYRAAIKPAVGRVLVKADLALIELCAAAEISGDTRMQEAIARGDDLHRLTAAAIFAKNPEDVTNDDRAFGKTVNFGTLYGQGLRGLLEAAAKQGLQLTEAEGQAVQSRFAKAWPQLSAWRDRQLRSASSLVRTRSGRIRRLKADAPGTFRVNTPIQGLAADGFKAALAELWNTRDRVPSAAPVLAVHDELVIEVDAADAEVAARWVSDCLQAGMERYLTKVPVRVDVTVARDWSGTPLDEMSADAVPRDEA